ncbi:protein YtiD [Escherichia coli]
MADYAEINNFPPELSSGGDKYFHLRNYSEYSEYTCGFFLSLMIFIKS